MLPDGTYGVYAGGGAKNLSVIDIPAIYSGVAVTQIVTEGFKDLTLLQSITIPNSITKINLNAFHGCSSLDNVNIPDSVTIIEDYAFSDCSSLTNISLGNGLTTIGGYCFQNCSDLKTISIPDSVTHIKAYALYGSSIEAVNMSTTPDDWTMENPQTAFVSASKESAYIKEHFGFSGYGNVENFYNFVAGWDWDVKSVPSYGSMTKYTTDEYPSVIANMLKQQVSLPLYQRTNSAFDTTPSWDVYDIQAQFYKTDWIKK